MTRRAGFRIPDYPRDRPTVDRVKPLADAIYALPDGGAGHCLHAVLDDGNIDDHSIQYCLDYAERRQCKICVTVAKMMLQMTKTQRRRC